MGVAGAVCAGEAVGAEEVALGLDEVLGEAILEVGVVITEGSRG